MASATEKSPLIPKSPKERSASVNVSPVSFTGGPGKSCWYRFRRSKSLVVGVVFGALLIDLMIITTIDPLLPDILTKFDDFEESLNESLEMDSTNHSTEHTGMTRYIGIVVATKPGIEIVSNLVVGYIVDRVGHRGPMVVGFFFNTMATIGFAYAPTFLFLLIGRVCQAIASSLSVVSGLALIACRFQDDTARSKALSTAFGGLSVGIVLGYPFGSTTYQFVGRAAPFLILAGLCLVDGILRLIIVTPNRPVQIDDKASKEGVKNMCRMLADPYILMALAINFAPNFGLGVFLATGPAWMLDQLNAEQWEIGTVLAIAMVWQIASLTVAGFFGLKYGRWKFCLFGMWFYALGISLYPFCKTIWYVLMPEIAVRTGFGIIICVVSPLLSFLADNRHGKFYGGVYGLYTASYNLGLTLGPIAGGNLLKPLTFRFLYWGVAIFVFAVSFFSFAFRNPTGHNTQLSPKKRDDDLENAKHSRFTSVSQNSEDSTSDFEDTIETGSEPGQDATISYTDDFENESVTIGSLHSTNIEVKSTDSIYGNSQESSSVLTEPDVTKNSSINVRTKSCSEIDGKESIKSCESNNSSILPETSDDDNYYSESSLLESPDKAHSESFNECDSESSDNEKSESSDNENSESSRNNLLELSDDRHSESSDDGHSDSSDSKLSDNRHSESSNNGHSESSDSKSSDDKHSESSDNRHSESFENNYSGSNDSESTDEMENTVQSEQDSDTSSEQTESMTSCVSNQQIDDSSTDNVLYKTLSASLSSDASA